MSYIIAIKFTGYDISNLQIDTFRYANVGVVADINDGSDQFYTELLKDSIIISQKSDSTKTDAIDMNLTNDAILDSFKGYAFKGYDLNVYVARESAPTSFYTLWTGKLDSVLVKEDVVNIKGRSNFDVLDNFINPTTFLGDLQTDPYDGDESIKDKVRPRLIGQAYNIRPVLLNPSLYIYGFNWDKDGNRAPAEADLYVRDGGLDLVTTKPMLEIRDFATTALMDAEDPPPEEGTYYTCKAESTFKLGSKPIFDITIDILSTPFDYAKWLQIVVKENDIFGYSVHKSNGYQIGGYFESQTSYKQADDYLSANQDIHLWFDNTGALNSTVVTDYDNPPVASFIESTMDFTSKNQIVISKLSVDSYELPINKVEVKYKKNYAKQSVEALAGSVSEADALLFENDYLSVIKNRAWANAIYPVDNDIEAITSITDSTDAETEATRIRDKTSGDDTYGLDYITIDTPVLEDNGTIILGVVPDGVVNQADFSSTTILVDSTTYTMDNNNSDFTGQQQTILVGDPVLVSYSRLGFSSTRGIVSSIVINTRTMMVSYQIQIARVIV